MSVRTTASLVLAALGLCPSPLRAQQCGDPDVACSSGSIPGEMSFTARFGTDEPSCDECVEAVVGDLPPPSGCRFAEWDSELETSVPALTVPKFVPPSAGALLVQADVTLRGRLCGVLQLENRDPDDGVDPSMSVEALITVRPPVDSGTGTVVPGFPTLPVLSLTSGVLNVPLDAFDGRVDFDGPSGVSWTFDPAADEACLRIADPAILAALVDDLSDGPVEELRFEHAASDASFAKAWIYTFLNDPFGGVELTVRYVYCEGSSFCEAADGALAACPCGNPGSPDTGCDVSQGTGGVGLALVAQQTAPTNRATWSGTGFPTPGTPTTLVIRSATLNAGGPLAFGDGVTCIGAPLVRIGPAFAIGGTSRNVHGHPGAAGAGTFYYQLWFRNKPVSYCDPTAAYNLSNGGILVW